MQLSPLMANEIQLLNSAQRRAATANGDVVIRAGPGSGKTRVFVEALRRQLEGWTSMRSGIAALSFTNVAHEVVTERLGGAPPAPHFIGTIDSFLLSRFGGEAVIEAGNASRTQLFNVVGARWDEELLSIFDIPIAAMPRVVSSIGPLPAAKGLAHCRTAFSSAR